MTSVRRAIFTLYPSTLPFIAVTRFQAMVAVVAVTTSTFVLSGFSTGAFWPEKASFIGHSGPSPSWLPAKIVNSQS